LGQCYLQGIGIWGNATDVRAALSAGDDPNCTDEVQGGQTWATSLALLCQHVGSVCMQTSLSPLMHAAAEGKHDCLQLLLDAGADVNDKDNVSTALFSSACTSYIQWGTSDSIKGRGLSHVSWGHKTNFPGIYSNLSHQALIAASISLTPRAHLACVAQLLSRPAAVCLLPVA
jgi:hypothetical protein